MNSTKKDSSISHRVLHKSPPSARTGVFLHDSGYGAEKRNSPPAAPSRLFLLCCSQVRHGIDIKMLLRGRRDGMHQLRVGPHDLPPADIAVL